jgi:hypothetical protein
MSLRAAAVALLIAGLAANAQDFTQRGTLEYRGWGFFESAPNDSGLLIGESLFRYEFSKLILPGFRLFGTTETRVDTHRQVDRRFYVNFSDRELQRPAFSIRRASVLYNRGPITIEAGKQLIRWGKADILNPTDRFAPRDFLNVVDTEFLGVLAGRVAIESKSETLELVLQPRFTPSRTPLLNQRWTVLPEQLQGVPIRDDGSRFPAGPNYGARWNHLGRGYEASLSFFNGRHYLPFFEAVPAPPGVAVTRTYPELRLIGGDAAVPLPWFTFKAEAAWFTSKTANADEYVLHVWQLERQIGELSLVGGYAGEWVTKRRNPLDFAPDRGLARSFLGRAGYTIDPRRSVAAEWAVRQNGDGTWVRLEYSQSFGQNWRAIGGFTLIGGDPSDFLGQYRRNSHGFLTLRYTF